MTDLEEFTLRMLLSLKTAKADGDHKSIDAMIDALASEYGIASDYAAAE